VLLIPFLLFVGYAVAAARGVRRGSHELPAWDHLGLKLKDGFLLATLFSTWYLPGALLVLLAEISSALGALAALGGVWGLLILTTQAAIWSQYLEGGFRAGFDVAAIIRRVQFNLGLTIVVGAVGIALLAIALSGFIIVIGVLLTAPYASWVAAHLFGEYSRLTDETLTAGQDSARTRSM
jgi:uncharacterized membrane protein YesL